MFLIYRYGWQNVFCLFGICISRRLRRACTMTVLLYVSATPCTLTLCHALTPTM